MASPGHQWHPQDTAGVLRTPRIPRTPIVSSGYRGILRIPPASCDTSGFRMPVVSSGYRVPRMPPVSQDAKPRLQTPPAARAKGKEPPARFATPSRMYIPVARDPRHRPVRVARRLPDTPPGLEIRVEHRLQPLPTTTVSRRVPLYSSGSSSGCCHCAERSSRSGIAGIGCSGIDFSCLCAGSACVCTGSLKPGCSSAETKPRILRNCQPRDGGVPTLYTCARAHPAAAHMTRGAHDAWRGLGRGGSAQPPRPGRARCRTSAGSCALCHRYAYAHCRCRCRVHAARCSCALFCIRYDAG